MAPLKTTNSKLSNWKAESGHKQIQSRGRKNKITFNSQRRLSGPNSRQSMLNLNKLPRRAVPHNRISSNTHHSLCKKIKTYSTTNQAYLNVVRENEYWLSPMIINPRRTCTDNFTFKLQSQHKTKTRQSLYYFINWKLKTLEPWVFRTYIP